MLHLSLSLSLSLSPILLLLLLLLLFHYILWNGGIRVGGGHGFQLLLLAPLSLSLSVFFSHSFFGMVVSRWGIGWSGQSIGFSLCD